MEEADRLACARQRMIDEQLRARGIHDGRLLAAFARVPREAFVPAGREAEAYNDHPVGIGEGQTVSQPYMIALMAQELRLGGGQRVLEIGTGSGYQTAILVELGCRVFTIERRPALAERARARLEALGCAGVSYRVGDGTLGWPEEAPFDGITVGAGSPRVPPALVEQLAPGGRLVIPVGGEGFQELTVVERGKVGLVERVVCPCVFVPLIGAGGWTEN